MSDGDGRQPEQRHGRIENAEAWPEIADTASGELVGRYDFIRNFNNDAWWQDEQGNHWLVVLNYANDPFTNERKQVGNLLAKSVGSRGSGEVRVLAARVGEAQVDEVLRRGKATFADLVAFGAAVTRPEADSPRRRSWRGIRRQCSRRGERGRSLRNIDS